MRLAILFFCSACAWTGTTGQGIRFEAPPETCRPAVDAWECADALTKTIAASERAFFAATGQRVPRSVYARLDRIVLTDAMIPHASWDGAKTVRGDAVGLFETWENGKHQISVYPEGACVAESSLAHELMHLYRRRILGIDPQTNEEAHADRRLWSDDNHGAAEWIGVANAVADGVCRGTERMKVVIR